MIRKKLKWFLIISIFFAGLNLQSQKTSIALTFQDNHVETGLGKFMTDEVIIFKKIKKEKPVRYHFSMLKKVILFDSEGASTYVYLNVSNAKHKKVLKELVVGEISLYVISEQGYNSPIIIGAGTGSGFSRSMYYDTRKLYVKRENQSIATHLGSNELFAKNFKRAASQFFKDCEPLVTKIQNKEFKKKHIKEIVEFYNFKCAN